MYRYPIALLVVMSKREESASALQKSNPTQCESAAWRVTHRYRKVMMNRRVIWFVLVIVLVCLNWFKHLVAQDLSGLSDAEKVALLEHLSGKPVEAERPGDYSSAPIYETDTAGLVRVPDSLGQQLPLTQTDQAAANLPGLTPFDELSPFGTGLFAGPRETAPPDDIAAASDYLLGPGDNLIVQLWGQVEKEYTLTIDREGTVFVPQVGKLSVWGRTLDRFEQDMRRALSGIYTDFELSVSLGKIRSIRIYLTGEVRRPGAYTVSSLTSLFNALFMAGGPNGHGSMRSIKLMRSGRPVAEVDLYRFLLEGDNSSDIRLQSGDAIFVPVAGPRVAVRGKIRRPAIYELVGEQTARELMELAGNPTPDAYLSRVMLERVSAQDEWEVLDIDLSREPAEGATEVTLEDGDRLTVFSVFEMKRNMVAAFGLVRYPSYYERNDSTRLSDLIERARLQPYDVHFKRANLFRRHDDSRREVISVDLGLALTGAGGQDILLHDGDSLHVYSISDVTWDRYIFVDGRVKNPGRYLYYDSMTVEDAIFLAGSFSRGASLYRAEIARVDTLGEVTLQQVDLSNRGARRLYLQEDDRVYVRQLPQWQLHRTVRIDGEVMYPGEYVLSGRDETLYDLMTRAGGITLTAFPRGTVFERSSIGEALARKQIPSLISRTSPVVRDSLGNIRHELLFEFEPNSMNRLVLNVDRLLETKGGHSDVVLQPGDRVYVPPIPSGISVLGAVGSSGTIKFADGQKAKYYVKRAGGFTSQADKKETRLISATGEVCAGAGTVNKQVELGDVIVVPTKIYKERSFTKTFATTLSAVTGVLTTILIIDRL